MRSISAIIAMILVCLLAALSCSEKSASRTDPQIETVKSYERLANAHQVDSLMLLYAENAYINVAAMGTFAGRNELRDLHHFDRALKTTLSFSELRSGENSVACHVWEQNEWLRQSGVDSVEFSEFHFSFNDSSLIVGIEAKLSPESEAAVLTAIGVFDSWARENRVGYYEPLFAESGDFPLNYKNGHMLLVLLYEMLK